VYAFHDPKRCAAPDLDHSWFGTHSELNFLKPNTTVFNSLNDGFVRVNDLTEQIDNGWRARRKALQKAQHAFDDLQAWNVDVQVHSVDSLNFQHHMLAQDLSNALCYSHLRLRLLDGPFGSPTALRSHPQTRFDTSVLRRQAEPHACRSEAKPR